MKITSQWMREFTPVRVTPQELAKQLTLAGLEVESVNDVAPAFSGVFVGDLLEMHRHPDAEKLSVCCVTTDGIDRLQIICGAQNVRVGLKVAVAMVGARLPGGVVIKRAKLRGLESFGMLCSARELGLGAEHDGIMELDASSIRGSDLREALQLDDAALEVNATPNRGDCMSVFGIARDYAAAQERRHLRYAVPAVEALDDAIFPVSIDAPSACPMLTSRVIRGVRANARSPAWLRERLRRVGINSISATVDVTNFVMMECGQPMHAYDLSSLKGGIKVRQALSGERITLLDDNEYALDPQFLVIADDDGAIGLAGIMGGRRTAISAATIDVLFEAAHFTPDAIAGRARRLGLFTDAGQRFERGVDPTLPLLAIERATRLLLDIAGGVAGPVTVTRVPDEEFGGYHWVSLRSARLASLLGVHIADVEVHRVLEAVSDRTEVTSEGWRVARPPHRFDIRIEADLIEEVARLRGFDCIQEVHALAPQVAGYVSEATVPAVRVLDAMIDLGFREVITYTFVDPVLQRQVFPAAVALALTNPISPELSEMRVSLWTGLLQAARENLRRQQSRVRMFELGKKFEVIDGRLHEIETLAGVATGARFPEQWGNAREALDFFDVKSDLLHVLGLGNDLGLVHFKAAELACLRPGRCARILLGTTAVGWLGEVHPQLAKSLNLPGGVFLLELEMDVAFSAKPLNYKKISKFPSVRRDLAIVVDEGVPLAALQENVTVSAAGLLTELRVFDIYRGPGVETGRKSIALGLILQDSSRTLTDVDADAVVTSVVARLRDTLSASIRDQ